MSAPTPAKTWFYDQSRIDAFHASFYDGATQSARLLGIPVAMSNKWGPWETALPGGIPPLLFLTIKSRFPGFTHVADSDGSELARVGEGVAVATVCLDPGRKRLSIPVERDRYLPWIADVPGEYRFFKYFEALGRRWYARHARRAAKAV